MRDITLCHPRLQKLAAQLTEECARQELKIKIGETLRTKEEQDDLYAQGRTKPGSIVTNAPGSSYSSYHQWGTAFDIYRNDGQGAYNESNKFFERVGAIGVSLGLEWGGNWKSIVDKPHFQLPDWGSSAAGIKKQYATPEEFRKTWEKTDKTGWIKDNTGWWYRYKDGGYTVNDWKQIDEKWYWFDGAGYAVMESWKKGREDKWYYLGADCIMLTSCIRAIKNEIYVFGSDGAILTGEIKLTTDQRGALMLN